VEKIEEFGMKGFGGLIFLQNIKLSSFEGTKKLYVVEEGFGGFERVYVNFSNLIYVIIFLKLKIY